MVSPRVAATPLPRASATPSDDFAAWRELVSVPLDEQSVRLHHRLTWIHPFPKGNGRAARVLVDCFLQQLGTDPFTWRRGLSASQARPRNIAAVRKADAGDSLNYWRSYAPDRPKPTWFDLRRC